MNNKISRRMFLARAGLISGEIVIAGLGGYMRRRNNILMGLNLFDDAAQGGAVAWTPATALQGVIPLCLKADSLVAADNDPVASWTASGSLSFVGAQTTAEKKPLYKTNILNGLPGILFDNSNDCIAGALDLSTYDKLTVFVLFSSAPGAISMVLELGWDNEGSFNVFREAENTVISNSISTGYVYSNYRTASILTTTPKLVCFTHDITLSTNCAVGWVNGVTGGTRPNNGDPSGNFANLTLNIGARGNGGYLPLNGYVFEVLLFPGVVLSDANRITVEDYIQSRWGDFL